MFDKNEQIVIVCTIIALVLFFLWRRRQRREQFNKPIFLHVRLAVILLAIVVLGIETYKSWNVIKLFALAGAMILAFYIYKQYSQDQDDDQGSND